MLVMLFAAVVLALQMVTPPGLSLRSVTIAPPVRVAELDMAKLKGEPWRLAWAPDGSTLYLQTAEQHGAEVKLRHYILPAGGGATKAMDQPPEWAGAYWTWKSAQAAPGAPALKLSTDERREIIRSTSAPRGAGIAGMGGDATAGGVTGGDRSAGGADPVLQGQNAVRRMILFRGEVVGEWVNAPIVPGLTFGWAPRPWQAIAFADKDGRITLRDAENQKRTVEGSKGARLPAWSEDGGSLAYLQSAGRKKYGLYVAVISPGTGH